jgi:hypothetical protein
VAGARYNYSLKAAENVEQLQAAPEEVRLYVNTGQLQSAARSPVRPTQPQSIQKFVGQRTFQMLNGYWTETGIADTTEQATRIQFDSEEYWQFVAKHPELKEILSLGTQVRFRQLNKNFEVFSKNN